MTFVGVLCACWCSCNFSRIDFPHWSWASQLGGAQCLQAFAQSGLAWFHSTEQLENTAEIEDQLETNFLDALTLHTAFLHFDLGHFRSQSCPWTVDLLPTDLGVHSTKQQRGKGFYNIFGAKVTMKSFPFGTPLLLGGLDRSGASPTLTQAGLECKGFYIWDFCLPEDGIYNLLTGFVVHNTSESCHQLNLLLRQEQSFILYFTVWLVGFWLTATILRI